MKFKNLLIFVVAIFVCGLFIGCGVSAPKTVIMEYKTQEVITEFSVEDYEQETIALLDAINNAEKSSQSIKGSPIYSILFKDKYSEANDVWYNVYVQDNSLYFSYDTEKIKNEYFTGKDDIKKCVSMTADEFADMYLIK